MGIIGMNHAVLYVRDARRQQRFYADVLGFATVIEDPNGGFVFMRGPDSPNHHDIAFFTIGDARRTVRGGQAAPSACTTSRGRCARSTSWPRSEPGSPRPARSSASDHGANKSLYAHDPDGLEFEVMWLVPADLWGDEEHEAIIRRARPRRRAGALRRPARSRRSRRVDGRRVRARSSARRSASRCGRSSSSGSPPASWRPARRCRPSGRCPSSSASPAPRSAKRSRAWSRSASSNAGATVSTSSSTCRS